MGSANRGTAIVPQSTIGTRYGNSVSNPYVSKTNGTTRPQLTHHGREAKRKADTEIQYRPRIVDTDIDCGHPLLRTPSPRLLEKFSKRFSLGGGRVRFLLLWMCLHAQATAQVLRERHQSDSKVTCLLRQAHVMLRSKSRQLFCYSVLHLDPAVHASSKITATFGPPPPQRAWGSKKKILAQTHEKKKHSPPHEIFIIAWNFHSRFENFILDWKFQSQTLFFCSQRGAQNEKNYSLRKTRVGWNCRFQKTPRTEGGDKVQAVSTQQFSRDFPGVFLGKPRTDPGNSHSLLEFSDSWLKYHSVLKAWFFFSIFRALFKG